MIPNLSVSLRDLCDLGVSAVNVWEINHRGDAENAEVARRACTSRNLTLSAEFDQLSQ